jgi:predicted N-acyltransferase
VTFATERECRLLTDAGWLLRTDSQFHWRNEDYGSFADFLGTLASRKRKAIRRERAAALSGGVAIEWLTGRDITVAHWDAFFAFYMDTGGRKWGRPYLTRAFFSLAGAAMGERILLVMCRRAGRYIGGALNFIGGDTLYGRYWGSLEHHPFLHFETCYYQSIDFAIARGLKTVEAGAQGAHKIARGYAPAPTCSAHWIADPGFREAVADYLARERAAVSVESAELAEHLPFRRGGGTGRTA